MGTIYIQVCVRRKKLPHPFTIAVNRQPEDTVIHPAFIAIAKHPGLFFEHAGAYADLASAEASDWSLRLRQRGVLSVAIALSLGLGLALAGGAGLLCAAISVQSMPMPWLLVVIPAAPILIAGALALRLRSLANPEVFASVRLQMAQDLATLKILDAK